MLSQVIRFPKGILWAHGGGLNAMDGLALSLIKAVFGLILPPVKAVFGLVRLPVNVEGVSTAGTRGGGWWGAEGMLSMIMTGSSSEGSTTACFAFFVPKLLVFAFLTISFFITFPEDISLAKYASTCNYLRCILSHTIASSLTFRLSSRRVDFACGRLLILLGASCGLVGASPHFDVSRIRRGMCPY